MKKYLYIYGGIIALSFLWTGSAFISVTYRLLDSYTSLQIDIYHVIIGYLLQVCGMILCSTGLRFRSDIFSKKLFYITIMVAESAVITAAMLSDSAVLSLGFAFVMNLLHGIVAGFYLTLLSCFVPQQYRGRIFGFGYAVGSVGSWILSLPFNGRFLKMDSIVIVYLFLIVITILLVNRVLNKYPVINNTSIEVKVNFELKSIINIFVVLVLLSMVKNIGFYFPSSDISGIINLEFSRAFYAIGLIAAGIINDVNRRYGAICCVASLVFSFFSFALADNSVYSAAIWIIGYIFFGFFSVYRVVVFSDIASNTMVLPFAAFGLTAGRTGDALGTLCGILLSGNIVLLLLATSILFILVIFMFFSLYQKLYSYVVTDSERKEQLYEAFEKKYNLTVREGDVFRLVVQGYSNPEISNALFVSESTVKYHVGNIFKKTGCSSRTNITMLFKNN